MFHEFANSQFSAYREAFDFFSGHPECLIGIEALIMEEMRRFTVSRIPEIVRDYNEASYLYPFWQNYPPLSRGRQPKGDQHPWIEVGERVLGSKLMRHFASGFSIRDPGVPAGSDSRFVLKGECVKERLRITDSVWVFADIKSVGPRDNHDHAVMSPYQVSGSGNWTIADEGIVNDPVAACGKRKTHGFNCSLPPIYVLSDGTIVPLVTFAIMPIYDMCHDAESGRSIGQPLKGIKVASIPNGILLMKNPNLIQRFPRLFFPGKDDRGKDPRKCRARVDFATLKRIDQWRVFEIDLAEGGRACESA